MSLSKLDLIKMGAHGKHRLSSKKGIIKIGSIRFTQSKRIYFFSRLKMYMALLKNIIGPKSLVTHMPGQQLGHNFCPARFPRDHGSDKRSGRPWPFSPACTWQLTRTGGAAPHVVGDRYPNRCHGDSRAMSLFSLYSWQRMSVNFDYLNATYTYSFMSKKLAQVTFHKVQLYAYSNIVAA